MTERWKRLAHWKGWIFPILSIILAFATAPLSAQGSSLSRSPCLEIGALFGDAEQSSGVRYELNTRAHAAALSNLEVFTMNRLSAKFLEFLAREHPVAGCNFDIRRLLFEKTYIAVSSKDRTSKSTDSCVSEINALFKSIDFPVVEIREALRDIYSHPFSLKSPDQKYYALRALLVVRAAMRHVYADADKVPEIGKLPAQELTPESSQSAVRSFHSLKSEGRFYFVDQAATNAHGVNVACSTSIASANPKTITLDHSEVQGTGLVVTIEIARRVTAQSGIESRLAKFCTNIKSRSPIVPVACGATSLSNGDAWSFMFLNVPLSLNEQVNMLKRLYREMTEANSGDYPTFLVIPTLPQ